MASHRDAFVQEATGVLSQIEDQSLHVRFTETLEVVFHLLAGVLIELRDLHVRDSGTKPERIFNAGTGNFVANDIESDGFVGAFASNGYLDVCRARPLQQV